MTHFQIIGLTPSVIIDPSIAIAACRAGGIGALDLEYVTGKENYALKAIDKFIYYTRENRALKIDCKDKDFVATIEDQLSKSFDFIILVAHNVDDLTFQLQYFHGLNLTVLFEARSLEMAQIAVNRGADGLIAKGYESGGWVSNKTSFVLLQQFVKNFDIPVWIQGGIGLHTATGCFAAGAAGIALDGQLLLSKESPLDDIQKAMLSKKDAPETVCLGESLGKAFRVYAQPNCDVINDLEKVALSLASENSAAVLNASDKWMAHIVGSLNGYEFAKSFWPLSQDTLFAKTLAESFHTVGGIFKAIRKAVLKNICVARKLQPLKTNSPLALAHFTKYPIVQGPMAWVSDNPRFVADVAASGALPFLSLGLRRSHELKKLLAETEKFFSAQQSWGVGILGFLHPEIRQEQLQIIKTYRPPFALISGGSPAMALDLEKEGISTYVHVASAEILKIYIKAGIRRFVLEGLEGGGHVGPRSSFMLWNSIIEALLVLLPAKELADCHVLFAGGIHDGLSSAVISGMVAPLAQQGVRVGVQLGTAYLLTAEAVTSGAISDSFQKQALNCTRTTLLTSAPGRAVRCAMTPYAEKFNKKKQQLLDEKKKPQEIRKILEEMNFGRLCLASRGIKINKASVEHSEACECLEVGKEEQLREGLFMVGQVAALRNQIISMEQLHKDIAVDGAWLLKKNENPIISSSCKSNTQGPCDIAIIGMGCIMPKALGVYQYWENILNKVNAVVEVPEDRWDWKLYYESHRTSTDKISSKWGGFINDAPFNPNTFGIPPNTLPFIQPLHFLTLMAVQEALMDADYIDRPFNKKKTSVILGLTGAMPDLAQQYVVRANLLQLFRQVPVEAWQSLSPWTEDTFPGILTNVTASRIAKSYRLEGVNYTVDAACASSLAAFQLAVRDLESGRSDLVITGGADGSQNPWTYLCFSNVNALSPSGNTKPFDETADGTVISEGVGIAILKRRIDAQKDGDRIYALVKGVGGSSDGRGKGLVAPRPEGQKLAIKRAYAQAKFCPSTVDLIEAHGTGTVVGDKTEIEVLKKLFENEPLNSQRCALGSVKSMIGHTKAAAGIAGIIKTALALHHKILPPTIGVSQPNKALNGSRFFLNTEACPWIGKTNGIPKRAGVSAFGFGGINFHAVLEEYSGKTPEHEKEAPVKRWPTELFVWSYQNRQELMDCLDNFLTVTENTSHLPQLRDLASSLWEDTQKKIGKKLAVIAESIDDLKSKLKQFKENCRQYNENHIDIHDPKGIYCSEKSISHPGNIAFLFPGQGAQYANMLRELAIFFPEVRKEFELAEFEMSDYLDIPLSYYIFPEPFLNDAEKKRRQEVLNQSNATHPAIGAACLSLYELLKAFDLKPDMIAGHSYGEWVALAAAGVFEKNFFYKLSESPGRFVLETAKTKKLGTMAAVAASPRIVEDYIHNIDEVWVSNQNSPIQTIISGKNSSVQKALESFKTQGIWAIQLDVGCAFHSPLIASIQDLLITEFFSKANYCSPQFDVFSNTSAKPYPHDAQGIFSVLKKHFVKPVRFMEEIDAMYEKGARIFVEVGPKNILTNRVGEILDSKPHLALSMDQQGVPALTQLQKVLAQLLVHGVPVRLDRLFQGRRKHASSLEILLQKAGKPADPTPWMVNGGYVWHKHRVKKPLLGPIPKNIASQLKPRTRKPSIIMENVVSYSQLQPQVLCHGNNSTMETELKNFHDSMEKLMKNFLENQNELIQNSEKK